MKRFWSYAFGLTLVGLISALPNHLVAYTGEKLAKSAKVSIERARAIARQTRAGAITDEELEQEKGGSGLRYSFDIKSGRVVYDRSGCADGQGSRKQEGGASPRLRAPARDYLPVGSQREAVPAAGCPFRKLNPTVLMVKSAQDVASDDAAAALNGSAMWGIFLQAEMGPCRVVIRSVFLQDAPKMGLAPHDHVVKTLTSD